MYTSPKIKVNLNGIDVEALVDTGSEINGVAEEWFDHNKNKLGKFELLPVSNTSIKGATGAKSKRIRKQIFLDLSLCDLQINVIFLVIPGLIKDCILGISTLREYGCIINLPQNTIKLTKNLNNQQPNGENNVFKMLTMQTVSDEMETEMKNKFNEMEGVTNEQKQKLMQILRRNQEIFSDKPGRITAYEHEITVIDKTPFIHKGWRIPIAYQQQVDEEINKMLRHNIIERAASPYRIKKVIGPATYQLEYVNGSGKIRGYLISGNSNDILRNCLLCIS